MRKRKDAPSRRELFAVIRRLAARNAELAKRIEQQAQRIDELERELATLGDPATAAYGQDILDALIDSHHTGGQRVDTPHLRDIRYAPSV